MGTMQVGRPTDARAMLTDLYWAAVEAAAPGPALRAALDRVPQDTVRRIWILALGKAAHAMADAAVEALRKRRRAPAGGLIVSPQATIPPHPSLTVAVGNHPMPGPRSFAAATRLGDIAARVQPEDEAWVLLSGGVSSLIAAPDGVIKPDELVELNRLLLTSGLDIVKVNTVRKRFSRWGAGRLAQALSPALVRCYVVSDVVGDDLAAIGSGPCVPDPTTAPEVHALLADAGLWDATPPSMRRYLLAVERDPALETPKPGDSIFWDVEKRVIASNRSALDAAARRAADYGYRARVLSATLTGEAAVAGRRLAATLLGHRGLGGACLIWGGETTVKLDPASYGIGGRCQELALAAARELGAAEDAADGAALLAAGTDGRDGLTDAAGAIVDAGTWARLSKLGRDAEADLRGHDAYTALDAAGCLLRTGLTGTNVMDIVVGVRG